MTALNHALTGTAIGLIVGRPELAIPLALLSHYICDVLPHFGTSKPDKALKSSGFRNYLIAEALACMLMVVGLFWLQPVHWLLAAVCAFVAAAPDLLSINRYLKTRQGKPWRPNPYSRLAKGIQWFERPVGALIEITWLITMGVMIYPYL